MFVRRPTAWMDDEASLIGELAHNLNADRRRRCDTRAGIGAVGIGELHERVSSAGQLKATSNNHDFRLTLGI